MWDRSVLLSLTHTRKEEGRQGLWQFVSPWSCSDEFLCGGHGQCPWVMWAVSPRWRFYLPRVSSRVYQGRHHPLTSVHLEAVLIAQGFWLLLVPLPLPPVWDLVSYLVHQGDGPFLSGHACFQVYESHICANVTLFPGNSRARVQLTTQ